MPSDGQDAQYRRPARHQNVPSLSARGARTRRRASMASPVTSAEPMALSFVISRTENFNQSHKSEIYSHIARQSHRKRRQHQNRRMLEREESLESLTCSSLSDTTSHARGEHIVPEPMLFCAAHGAGFVTGCQRCLVVQFTIRGLKIESLVCYQGNSDPFNSQTIDIDARAGYYLDIGFNYIDIFLLGTGL